MSVIKRMMEEKRLGKLIEWDKERILALLQVSDKAVMHAVVRIHKNQAKKNKTKQPGLGWDAYDKLEMERLAKYLFDGFKLTKGQIDWLRYHRRAGPQNRKQPNSRIGRYHRQLLEHIHAAKQGQLI